MAEKSDVIVSLMATERFRNRVRAIAASKAGSVLAEATPDANHLAWAKMAIASGFDAWVESVLILVESQPATVLAAMTATDAQYVTLLNTVFAKVVKARVQ